MATTSRKVTRSDAARAVGKAITRTSGNIKLSQSTSSALGHKSSGSRKAVVRRSK